MAVRPQLSGMKCMQNAQKIKSTGKRALFTVSIIITFDHNNKFVIVWWSANTTSGFTFDICSNNNVDEAFIY